MNTKVRKVAQELVERFIKEHSFHEVYEEDGNLVIDIQLGDWKHDHLYAKYAAREALASAGFIVCGEDSQVYEESGSDCYSAIHTLRVVEA